MTSIIVINFGWSSIFQLDSCGSWPAVRSWRDTWQSPEYMILGVHTARPSA